MELFAIVALGTTDILWAGLTSPEEADYMAVRVSIARGNVTLLSGSDLATFLQQRSAV